MESLLPNDRRYQMRRYKKIPQWPQEGDFWSGSYRMIHTGSLNGNAGVGIMLRKSAGMRIKSYLQFNERLVMVKIDTKPVATVVVQVYMPTSDYEDEEVEDVYQDIAEVIKQVRGEENLIILGDWNAVVGEGQDGIITGKYGLGN